MKPFKELIGDKRKSWPNFISKGKSLKIKAQRFETISFVEKVLILSRDEIFIRKFLGINFHSVKITLIGIISIKLIP